MNTVEIHATLTITPAENSTRQAKVCFSAFGETVFDTHEGNLEAWQKQLIASLCAAQSRLLAKYGQKVNPHDHR